MNDIKCIFFDLDGTLTDSAPGLAESFTYIFRKHGITHDGVDLRYFMGPPIMQTLKPYFSTQEQLEAAVEDFRSHYSKRLLTGNGLFPGIAEMLEALKANGYTLDVVTAKPQAVAETVVEHFGIRQYLNGVHGTHSGIIDKIHTLREALADHNCPPTQAVMVGDRRFDLEAAQLGNTLAIGALWGYGDLEELEPYNRLFLAATPADITKYFRKPI